MKIQNLLAMLAMVLLAGCAMKTKIMDASAVSMTKSALADGEKLTETGPVSGKFCPDGFKDKGSFGLIDEAVKDAQAQSGVDFILQAAIYHEGNCVTIEGTGAKIVAAAMTPAPTASAVPSKTAAKHHRKK